MTATPIYLTWLNYLGGFEYFLFTAKKDYNVDIEESGEQRKNIFPNYPDSYGSYADTIRQQTFIRGRNSILVRSQHLTRNQMEVISTIKTSPLVQILESRTDRRTVLVDKDSYRKYSENDDLFEIQFTIFYTDEIPSQPI